MELDVSHLSYHNLRIKYDVNVHLRMIYEVGKSGKTIEAFCNRAGITTKTCYEWAAKYPEFKANLDAFEGLAFEWWCDLGLQNCDNELWDNTVWKHTMNTRFRKFTNGNYLVGFSELKKSTDRHQYIVEAVARADIIGKEAKHFTDLIESGERIKQMTDNEERLKAIEKTLGIVQ